jgi:hypothetical protein
LIVHPSNDKIIIEIGGKMKNEVFVTGYAKLPQGITASELYTVICVGILVDKETGIILDAECSLVTSLAKRVFKELVVNKNLNDIESIEAGFVKHYYGSAKKALISAMRTCHEKLNQI